MKILLIGGPKAGCLEEPGPIFVDGECYYTYDHGARAYVVANGVDHALAKFIEARLEDLQLEVCQLQDDLTVSENLVQSLQEDLKNLAYELADERAKNSNQTS